MQVEYSNVEILQGLAGEMCREKKYEKASQTLFNASHMLQELVAADKPVPFSQAAADILDDIACTQELQGKLDEAYKYQWVRLKVLTGFDNPVLQEWTADVLTACEVPAIADVYSALSTILSAKGEKARVEGNFMEAMVFLADAVAFLDRCYMFKDNEKHITNTRRKMVLVLQALGRLDEACRYDPPANVLRVQCPNAQPYIPWTNEKIFHRPVHGEPPVPIAGDGDMSRSTFVGLVRNPLVDDAQKKLETEHVLKCLRSVAAVEGAQKKMDADKALMAKQLDADRVFQELLNEEEAKVGAKEGRISKRKARRLQKAKREAEAAPPEPPPPQDPEQWYRAALESLDVSLQCPLTLATMKDPVVTQYGHTFERKDIELWFKTKNTCPMTGAAVASKALAPNIALKAVIVAAEALKEAAQARERAVAEQIE
jgi:hypothetical protein